jgi:hypothetical protein
MAESIVETIIVKLGLDVSSYNPDTEKAIRKTDGLTKSMGKADDFAGKLAKSLAKAFTTSAILIGIGKIVDQVAKLNDQLFFLEKNLGMSSQTIQAWQNAAGAMGGSADGMTSSMKSLNGAMNDFVTMGDTSMLPYMNALGVSMVDMKGKARDTDKVMLDLADSFSKMDREQAFSIASKMGIDEGTFNTLVQGRKEMEKMIEYQKTMYKSSEAELQVSRDLQRNRALLGQHWESMKTMMANALMPLFLKASEVLLGLFEYLQKHQKAVQAVFKGIAFVLTAILIPSLVKGAIAALAFIAPFAPFILVVGALGAAFGLLYDDYKVWAEGGKSLFDWGLFSDYIDKAKSSTDNLSKAFKDMGEDLVKNTIPTLRGYADIISKLKSGDIAGASSLAGEMVSNFSDRMLGYVDTAMGNEKGTASNAVGGAIAGLVGTVGNVMPNSAGTKAKGKPTAGFTEEKGKSIARVAKNIGVNPNDLAAVISFETGGTFDPSKKNHSSSATGLIQFMSGSGGTKGSYYGMSRKQFGSLSFDEQMNYVEKYFKGRGFSSDKQRDVADTYTAVTGYGYKKGTQSYDLNKVWDSNKNGVVEKGEMVRNKAFQAHQRLYFGDQAQQSMSQSTIPMRNATGVGSTNSSKVDVKIDNINVKTSADTLKSTASAGIQAATTQIMSILPASK